MKNTKDQNLIHLLSFLICLVFVSSSISAQSTASIVGAEAKLKSNEWQIKITFDSQFNIGKDGVQLKKSANYRVFDFIAGQAIRINGVEPIMDSDIFGTKVILKVDSANPLELNGSYHIYAFNLSFNGEQIDPKAKLQSAVKVNKPQSGNSTNQSEEPESPTWTIVKAKDREDANIYAAYEVTKTKNKATTGAADIKVSIPFVKNFWRARHVFSPVTEIKINSDAEADADSLNFGGEWFYPVFVSNKNSSSPYRSVDWINSGKIEAPKNFDNVNAIWGSRLLFPSAFGKTGNKFFPYLDPFVGSEVGKNLKSPLKSAQGNSIARVYYGADLSVNAPFADTPFFKGLDFEATYIRRHPLTKELTFKKEENGEYSLVSFGKSPKDYANAKLIFKINDFIGPYIGFEWGRLPPNYNLVDHVWKFGIVYKSKIQR